MNPLAIALGILLGLIFVAAGLTKILGKREALIPRMGWIADFSPVMVRLIGVAETLGGIALLVLGPLGWRGLSLVAAICLAVTMILAIIVHIRRQERRETIPALVLLIMLVILIGLEASGLVA